MQLMNAQSVLGGLLYNQRTPQHYIRRLSDAFPSVPWQALVELTIFADVGYLVVQEVLPNEQAIKQAIRERNPALAAALQETADLSVDLLAATLKCPSWLVQVARWTFNAPTVKPKANRPQDWPGHQAWEALDHQGKTKVVNTLWNHYTSLTRVACHLGIAIRTLRHYVHDPKTKIFAEWMNVRFKTNKEAANRRHERYSQWSEGLARYETLAEYAHVENITVAAASARAKVVGHKPSNPKRPAELRNFNTSQVAKTIELYGLPDCQRHTTGWWAGICFRLQRDENTKQFDQYALRLVRQALVDNGFVLLPGSNNNKRWGMPGCMTQEEVEQIVSR